MTVTVSRSDLFVVFMLATGHKPDPEGLTPFALERIAAAIGNCGSEIEVRDVAESVPDFDWFWAQYPRKVGKLSARKAWDKALKHATADEIIAGATRFKDHWADEPKIRWQFIPHPTTWLNAGSWEDELVPHAGTRTKVEATRENLTLGAVALETGMTFADKMAQARQRELA